MSLTGLVARYCDAWNDHDARECAACFAPDGERVWRIASSAHLAGSPYPRFRGRAAIADAIAAFIAGGPDLRFDVDALSEGSDGRVWTEWRITGTHRGSRGDWAPAGEPVDLVGVSIFRVGRDGLREERCYWDSMLLRATPAGAAAPA